MATEKGFYLGAAVKPSPEYFAEAERSERSFDARKALATNDARISEIEAKIERLLAKLEALESKMRLAR